MPPTQTPPTPTVRAFRGTHQPWRWPAGSALWPTAVILFAAASLAWSPRAGLAQQADPPPNEPAALPGAVLDVANGLVGELLPVLDQVKAAGRIAKQSVDALDAATRQVSREVLGELRGWEGRSDLTVARLEQAMIIRTTETNWRGTITVETTVPCILHYAVDLGTLGAGDFRWDPQAKLLRVRLPEVRVQSVEPDLKRSTQRVTACTGFRFEFYDASEIQQQALREIGSSARERAGNPELLKAARAAAREETANLLGKALRAARIEGQVIAE